MAAKAMALTARSRLAEGAIITALLPESSRIGLAKRLASRSPTARPIAVEPVAETSGTRLSSASISPNLAEAFSKRAWAASAVKGVLSDGFQMQAFPHTSASAAFQDHTATGKLK